MIPAFTLEHYYQEKYLIRENGKKLAFVTDFKQAKIICKRLNELKTELKETNRTDVIDMCFREV